MKRFLGILAATIAIAIAMPAVLLAQQNMTFKQLDPTMKKALQRVLTDARLKELGIETFPQAIEEITVQVTTADCPGDCKDAVHNGQCHCPRDENGGCKEGQTETNRGGKDLCKVNPTTASIRGDFGRGSELQVLMR